MRIPTNRLALARLLSCVTVVAVVAGALIADDQTRDKDQKTAPESAPQTVKQTDVEVQHLSTAESIPLSLTHAENSTLSLLLTATRQNDSLIGVELTLVGDVLRSHLGLAEGKGFVVTAVEDDSPAAKAGILKNDVLITVGNDEIANVEGFHQLLAASAEKPLTIGLIRAGKKQAVEVTPRDSAARHALRWITSQVEEPKFWLGVGLAAADDALRSQLSLPAGEGLVVTNVEADSPAAHAGVMVNDVLLKLEGKALTTIEALSKQLQTIGDKTVPLELLRRGKPATLSVTPQKHATVWQTNELSENAVYPVQELIFFTPQNLERVTLSNGDPLTFEPVTVTYSDNLLRVELPKQNLEKQLADLEAQVKELEASLGALRGLLNTPAQAAPAAEKK